MSRILWVLLIASCCDLLCGFVEAQSLPQQQPALPQQQPALSQQLLAEGAASLAKAARERGNSVRGAILYPQKKLNCAGCHAQGATDLLGPDLTLMGNDVKDEYLVESILQPSQVIKKGFESVKVLTLDGTVIIGRILDENDARLVLRDASEASRPVTVARADIDQIAPSEKSAMPDGLADHLADRQQFLDLVKYLMEIAASGNSAVGANLVHAAGGGNIEERLQGLALMDQFGCTNCHPSDTKSVFPKKRAPELKSVAARIDPAYVSRFIADPLHVKPGTSMPDMMGTRDAKARSAVAEAITSYLFSRSETPFRRQSPDPASAARGRELFHSVGCVACHSPRDDDGGEVMAESSVPLGELEDKYNIVGLAAFLEDPHSVRPSGRMPNMVLSHWEAIDIANYLLQRTKHTGESDRDAPNTQQNPSQHAVGKRYFEELRCVQCHEAEGARARENFPPLADGRTDRGCLSSESGAWPRYELDQSQRDAIQVAIKQRSQPLTDPQQITLTMAAFRCFACHQRDDLGGVAPERDDFFHTSNENLGPQGRIPPTLTGVGGKLKPKWMREVLVSGRAIRPYMQTRMPQYGAENVAHLVDLFPQVDPLPQVEFGRFGDPKEAAKIGAELVGSGGLNCIACHTFQQKPSQTMSAVDLTEMGERLHKAWFYRYMRAPQLLSPNTVMPTFWPGGRAIGRDILDGDANQQLEAIWEYLLEGRQARIPRGLMVEPMELLATDEAVMLRRSYQGIGKRGIGVGYPGGVNLAFDAEQMRIGMIWKGPFADPGGVWRGQGSGNVRPLGTDLIRFAVGPELDDARSPWIVDEGRPPKHQFTGYYLDHVQRPTFSYRYDGIEVEDYSIDGKDDSSGATILKRKLTFTSDQPREDLAFRAGTGERIDSIDDHSFLLGGSLRILIDHQHRARIVDAPSGKQLLIPLDIPSGRSELQLQYVW